MKYYRLEIKRDSRLVGYGKKLKVSRQLQSLINLHGLNHSDRPSAVQAAVDISKNPLVEQVVLTHVAVAKRGVWQNGRRVIS